MVTTKLNLSMTEPQVRQIYAKQGDTGRVLDISLDQTPEDGTLRILRPDGVEVTSEAVTGGEVESGETFETLAEADVTELTVGIEPVQDLNGYDAPWVGGAGKNLCPNVGWVQGQINSNGGINSYSYSVSSDFILLHAGEYTVSRHYDYLGNVGDGQLAYHTYDLNKNHLSDSGWRPNNYSFSISEDSYIRITTRFAQNGVDITPAIVDDGFWCQIELGSTATAWQPYSNICPITGHDEVTVNFGAEQGTADETYTTSLGQTVYGGTLDMVSGVLTADKAMVTLNGSETWNEWRGAAYYTNVGSLVGGAGYPVEMMSNSFRWIGRRNEPPSSVKLGDFLSNAVSVGGNWNGNVSFFYDNLVGGVDNFKAWVASNPIQIVYTLNTPLTYTLTAQQIKTLVGTNNVWASSGDIVNITFTYGGLLSELPSEATSVVGKCYCDVEQNGVSSMPFTLNVKKNERES